MYHHVRREERVALATLLRAGYTLRSIATELGLHHSTLSRELRRNGSDGYHAGTAHVHARKRRQSAKRGYRTIENSPKLADLIEALLDPLVSPEIIAYEVGVVHETIYAWISRSRPDLKERLPYHGKKRRRYGGKRAQKQGWTKNVRPIDLRAEEERNWEGDTILGSTRARLLTHVERQSLFLVADRLKDGTADAVHATLKGHQHIAGTITYDRGSEFALWEMIERDTVATVYFAEPHHPWQRGKNENTNGRLRRVFPKQFDFGTIDQRDLDVVVDLMNHTPRKSLSWRTPTEVFSAWCGSD